MNFRTVLENYRPCNEQEAQDKRMMLYYADHFEDILNRSNETAHLTASAWIVNKTHDRVLMVFHNIYNSWSWTGGHADGDGDLLRVAIKEACEETHLENVRPLSEEAFSIEILTVAAHFKRGKYVVPHLHLNVTYLLEADDGQNISANPEENSAAAWFSLDEAVEASTEPDMKIIYRKLNEKLNALCASDRR